MISIMKSAWFYLVTVTAVVSLVLFSCSKDSSTGPADDENVTETSAIIGAAGGILEVENFLLTVPAAAFDEEYELTVRVLIDDNPFGVEAISGSFLLSGLPDSYSQSLEVMLGCEDTPSGISFIAIGQETFVPSLGRIEMIFEPLRAEVPASRIFHQPGMTNSIIGHIPPVHGMESSIHLTAVSHYDTVRSETGQKNNSGNFRLNYPVNSVDFSHVVALGSYLEQAYKYFGPEPDGIGFSFADRQWPVDVYILSLSNETFGLFVASRWGDDYSYLNFNSHWISDSENMRLTAGHEFFHLAQSLYDPRYAWSKATSGGDHYWLDEATAVWSEEMFTDQEDYISPIREGHQFAPFLGMHAGSLENPQYHGYGMSAVIKYLLTSGENMLADIYSDIANEKHPMEALIGNHPQPVETWLPAFFAEYVAGNIYDVGGTYFVAQKSGTFIISDETDIVVTFSSSDPGIGSYPDLSAKIFMVQLSYEGIDPNANIEFTATGQSTQPHVNVLKYKQGDISLIDSAIGSVTISEVRDITDEGAHLIAVVVNSTYSSVDYAQQSDYELKIEVKELPAYDSCSIFADVQGDVVDEDGDESVKRIQISSGQDVFCELMDYTFTGTWDYLESETLNRRRRGTLNVTVNSTFTEVLSFSVIDTLSEGPPESPNQGLFIIESASGINIPLIEQENRLLFKVSGTDACDHLTSISYSATGNTGTAWEWTDDLQDYFCEGDSQIWVMIRDWFPGENE